MRRVSIRSAPREAADILREEILSRAGDGDEWLLGSEDDMIRTLGISRPTLRQAARMLEQEQLLVVRRGIGGGLFGRRPTAEAVSHIASVYLRAQGAAYDDLISTQLLLGVECARLAAESGEAEQRTALRDYYKERVQDREHVTAAEFVEASVDFQRRVAELAGSPVLRLFVDVLMDLSEGSEPIQRIYADPERRAQTFSRHESIAQAIAAGNPRLAAERMRKHMITILNWVDEPTRSGPLTPMEPR